MLWFSCAADLQIILNTKRRGSKPRNDDEVNRFEIWLRVQRNA
jgi:hypothetical protein